MKILFVCSSNACRSPYCEFVMRRDVNNDAVLSAHIESVRSAAVVNEVSSIFSKAVVSIAAEGFSEEEILKHKPSYKRRDPKRFEEADVIIGMSKLHKLFTPKRFRTKFITLSEAATGKYTPVPDPFTAPSQAEYDKAMAVLKAYLQKYENKLKAEFTASK